MHYCINALQYYCTTQLNNYTINYNDSLERIFIREKFTARCGIRAG